jgi:hypothetical protein
MQAQWLERMRLTAYQRFAKQVEGLPRASKGSRGRLLSKISMSVFQHFVGSERVQVLNQPG